MIWIILAVAIAAAGTAYWWSQQEKPERPAASRPRPAQAAAKKPATTTGAAEADKPFRAVSIKFPRENCCQAARALEGKRFLRNEAPLLPLSECDVAKCQCAYVHHNDRRKGERERRDNFGLQTQLFQETTGQERRQRRGRRKTDHLD